jgi:hypothetical protein
MSDALYAELEELMRETFEGARPGQGTQYLDRDSGIRATMKRFTAEQASRPVEGRATVAAHVRHMCFHLRVASEWIAGDHSQRDWKASFEPQTVTPEEWERLATDLEAARQEYLRIMRSLPEDRFLSDGGPTGVVAHLAYHLGAIRQHLPQA